MENGTHSYINAFINNSSTITENAGTNIEKPVHKAVMYDENGDVVLAAAGNKAIGLILSDTAEPIKKGQQLHVLIKYIGLLEAAASFKKGDPVTINDEGKGIPASSGSFIFGWAYTAVEAGEAVQVQITRSGYMA